MSDKEALLKQLKIDRSATAESDATRRGLRVLIAIVLLALIASAAFGVLDRIRSSDDAVANGDPAATPQAPAEPAPSAPAPAATAARENGVLNASGYITARRKATVSAEITGRINEVLVEEGMAVEQGQIVARLDDALAQIDLGLARARRDAEAATVQSIEADLKEAKRVLARTQQLVHDQFVSEADLTRAEAAVENLTAQIARARAELANARLQVQRRAELVEDHLVRAPFGGVVVDKNAQPGEIISPISAGGGFTRTGVCTIVDMDSLEIEVDVNESFIGRVFPGQQVEARLDAYPDWRIPASVIAIVPTANRDKATVKVRIGIDTADNRILPDMGVKVTFLAEG